MLDTYGRLGAEAIAFVDRLITESHHGVVSPYAMTKSEFLIELAVVWQRHNALAATHWRVRTRILFPRRHQAVYRAALLLTVPHLSA